MMNSVWYQDHGVVTVIRHSILSIAVLFSLKFLSQTSAFTMGVPGTIEAARIQRPATNIWSSSLAASDSPSSSKNSIMSRDFSGYSSDDQATVKPCSFSHLLDLNQAVNRLADAAASAPDSSTAIQSAYEGEVLWLQALERNDTDTDVVTFNTVLKGWAKCCVRMAELRYGFESSTTSNAIDNSSLPKISIENERLDSLNIFTPKDAVLRAQQWLLSPPPGGNLNPNTQSFNIVMDAWAKSREPSAPHHVEQLFGALSMPDSLSYHAWADAYAYSTGAMPHRIEQINHVVSEMEARGMKPSIRTINSILSAYSRQAKQQPQRAYEYASSATEILLKQEKAEGEDYQPDVMTYTAVMDCWSRVAPTNDLLPHEKTEGILARLQERARLAPTDSARDKLTPNIFTYTALLKAWSRAPSQYQPVRKCEAILDKLFLSVKSPSNMVGGLRIPPVNAIACTAALQTYARSKDPMKANKALDLLKRMRQANIMPTLITYNMGIDVCSRTRGNVHQQTSALKIAFAILKTIELDSAMTANQVTFGYLLQATAFLMPPSEERNMIASAVFKKATDAGQVDETVLKNLQKSCDADLYYRLSGQVAGMPVDVNHFPPSWNRNVRTL